MISRSVLAKRKFNRGYIPRVGQGILDMSHWVCPTANLAVRRELLNEIGGFDEKCVTGEDMDLSLRIMRSPNWQGYVERRAVIRHRFRPTFLGLLKQWKDYTRFHPYVLKKYTEPGIEAWYLSSKGFSHFLFRIPLPIRVIVMFGAFYLFHLSLAVALIAYFLHASTIAWIAAIATIYFGFQHVKGLSVSRPLDKVSFFFIRYILNWVCCITGFSAGLKEGMIYFGATREK